MLFLNATVSVWIVCFIYISHLIRFNHWMFCKNKIKYNTGCKYDRTSINQNNNNYIHGFKSIWYGWVRCVEWRFFCFTNSSFLLSFIIILFSYYKSINWWIIDVVIRHKSRRVILVYVYMSNGCVYDGLNDGNNEDKI